MEKSINNLFIKKNSSIRDAFVLLNKNAKKFLIVVEKENKLLGTLTDGDIRKYLLKGLNLDSSIDKIFNKSCFYIKEIDLEKKNILSVFSEKKIEFIPVINKSRKVVNVLKYNDFHKSRNYSKKIKNISCDLAIMAGGFGERLKPFTEVLPKPLIPIGNVPIISLIIDRFEKFGVKNIFISLNYKSEIVKAYLTNSKISKKIKFLIEKKRLGTCGSLSLIKKNTKRSLMVSNCDVLLDIDYHDFYENHKKNKNDITLVAAIKKFTIPYGSCELLKNGDLKKIKEKPSSQHLINTGLYLVEPKVLKIIKKNKRLDFDELINEAKLKKLKIGVYPIDDSLWSDFGQWDQYSNALKKFNND